MINSCSHFCGGCFRRIRARSPARQRSNDSTCIIDYIDHFSRYLRPRSIALQLDFSAFIFRIKEICVNLEDGIVIDEFVMMFVPINFGVFCGRQIANLRQY